MRPAPSPQQQQSLDHPYVEVYYDRQGRQHERLIDDPRRGRHRPHADYYPAPRQPAIYLKPYAGGYAQQAPMGNFAAQPQQQQDNQGYGQDAYDDYYDEQQGVAGDYYDDYYSYDEDEGAYGAPQAQQQQQQVAAPQNPFLAELAAKHAPYQDFSDEQLTQEAKVKYDTIEHKGVRTVIPKQFLDANGKLKNQGNVILALSNGYLQPSFATRKSDVVSTTERMKNLTKGPLTKNDLVESFTIEITSNFPQELDVSFPNIPLIDDEFYGENVAHVKHTIPAGALLKGPYSWTFKRTITNGIIAFTDIYESPAPDTMESSISTLKNGYSLVPFRHAVVYYWNKEHATDGKAILESQLEPVLDGNVKMLTTDVEKFLKIAGEGVSGKISLGNVTSDIMVMLSVPEPSEHAVMRHRMAAKAATGDLKQVAPEFKGFADANYILGANAAKEGAVKRFMEERYTFAVKMRSNYLKCGRKINFTT